MNAKGIRIGRGAVVAAFLVVFGGALCFSACAKNKQQPLSAPTNLTIRSEVLTWDAVDGAVGYGVEINGSTYRTENPEFDIFEITNVPKTVYQMKVIALGDYETTTDSAWSEPCEYSFESPKGLRINLAVDGQGYEIVVDNAEELTGKIVIPTTANGLPVTAIGKGGFKDCTGITGIILPDGVSFLDGSGGFEGCTALERIKLPADLKTLPESCFYGCERLKQVDLPVEIEEIPEYCFFGCDSLKQIVIPAKVKSISVFAFSDCSALEQVSVAEGNTAYRAEGAYVYDERGKEKQLLIIVGTGMIPEDTKTLMGVSLVGYNSVKRLVIPASLEDIGLFSVYYRMLNKMEVSPDSPFFKFEGDCLIRKTDNVLVFGMDTSVIPEGVVEIGPSAFFGRSFSEIALPSTLKKIGVDAFARCENLAYIKFPDGMTTIARRAFHGCTALRGISFPSSMESVEPYAFEGCCLSVLSPTEELTISAAYGYHEGEDTLTSYAKYVRTCSFYGTADCELETDENGQYVSALNTARIRRMTNSTMTDIIVPYRKGYTFKGWATEAGSATVQFGVTQKSIYNGEKNVGVSVSLPRSQIDEIQKYPTLYAVWEKNA